MSKKKEDIKTKYRITCINHLTNGGTIIDSMTVYEYDNIGEAIDDCSKMAKNASEGLDNIHIEIENKDTYGYVSVYRDLIPLFSYSINPIEYNLDPTNYNIKYRGFIIEFICNKQKGLYREQFIVYNYDKNSDNWYPLTVKNTVNECVIFIDQFSYTTITFMDSTFDTIEGSKLCLPHPELNSKFKRKTILPVS